MIHIQHDLVAQYGHYGNDRAVENTKAHFAMTLVKPGDLNMTEMR